MQPLNLCGTCDIEAHAVLLALHSMHGAPELASACCYWRRMSGCSDADADDEDERIVRTAVLRVQGAMSFAAPPSHAVAQCHYF